MTFGLTDTILTEIVLVIGIFVVLYIIFKLGKFIIGMIVNAVLGFISIYLINLIFNVGIPWNWVVIIITAICGLPGVAAIVILKLLGISLGS